MPTSDTTQRALDEMRTVVAKVVQSFIDGCPEGFAADDVADAIVDICSDELSDLYRARAERDRLRAELEQARAQVAGVWPCTCGHLPNQHKYDAVLGRDFCRSCPTATDLHDFEPATRES